MSDRQKGQPRAFATEQDFLNKFKDYIEYCVEKERFPNIAGFARYAEITRDTYYAQKEYYSDIYNMTRDILEDEVWQDNTYRAQLYLKSVFGHTDRQAVVSENTNINHDVSSIEEAEDIIKKAKEDGTLDKYLEELGKK